MTFQESREKSKRNRGCGRGQSRSLGKMGEEHLSPKHLDLTENPVPGTFNSESLARDSFQNEHERMRATIAQTRKELPRFCDLRKQYIHKKKQLKRTLLLNAPPIKHERTSTSSLPSSNSGTDHRNIPLTAAAADAVISATNAPPSMVSYESCVKVPIFSPLQIDWMSQEIDSAPSQSDTLRLKHEVETYPTSVADSAPSQSDTLRLKHEVETYPTSIADSAQLQSTAVTEISRTDIPRLKHEVETYPTSIADPVSPQSQPPRSVAYRNVSFLHSVFDGLLPLCSLPRTQKISVADLQKENVVKAKVVEKAMCDFMAEEYDVDNLDDVGQEIIIDFTSNELAHGHETLEPVLTEWLWQTDNEADKYLTELVPSDYLTFDWSNDVTIFKGKKEIFRGHSGPTFDVANKTPLDIFLKYFDTDVLNHIVTETNRQINCIQRPLEKNSRLSNVTPTDMSEMAVFIAVLIFQGLGPLTVEKDYWGENGFLTLKYFKDIMSYNRFSQLKRLLYFSDNTEQTGDTKLRRIAPLLDLLADNFSKLYLPSQHIAIDESLLKWHGRLGFAEKVASKATKCGIKTYELCESSTGYLWRFFICTDKDHKTRTYEPIEAGSDGPSDIPPPTKVTLKIVLDLIKPLLNRGYILTLDSFYNCPLLARYLKLNGTDCFGTLRVNREFVPEAIRRLTTRELRFGEVVNSYCQDLTVTLWRDANLVAMISTFHDGVVGDKEKYDRYHYKPQVVLDYNTTMGGVDKKDRLLSANPIDRIRNQGWYKKVFRRLLNTTVLNALIVYRTAHPGISHRQFRKELAESLCTTFRTPVRREPTLVTVKYIEKNRPILTGNHFIGTGPSKYQRCKWCKKARSKYICKQCNVALCLEICFEEYHTKE